MLTDDEIDLLYGANCGDGGPTDICEKFARAVEAVVLAKLAAAEMPERYDWVRDVEHETTEDVYTEAQLQQAHAQGYAKALSAEPWGWVYTLEYGSVVVDTKASDRQLNYPFGICGADYLAKNHDGISYVRQTPLFTRSTT